MIYATAIKHFSTHYKSIVNKTAQNAMLHQSKEALTCHIKWVVTDYAKKKSLEITNDCT